MSGASLVFHVCQKARRLSTFCSEIRAHLPEITGQVSPISFVAGDDRQVVMTSPATSLPPRLGEAFGGSAGLVGVGVDRHALDLAVCPQVDECLLGVNPTDAASRTSVLADHCKADSVANVESLHIKVKLVVSADPVLPKAPHRCLILVGAQPH